MPNLRHIHRALAAGLLACSALPGALAATPAPEVYGPGEWFFKDRKVFGPDSVLELRIIGIGSASGCVRCSPILVFEQGVQFDGTLRVVMEPSWFVYGTQFYTLFSFLSARPEGQFSQIELPALSGDLAWNDGDLYLNGRIQAQSPLAVPEPSTWALWLAGLGMVGALVRRRVRTA
jgi:PEP-CTERM motif